jgi:hypothetical protein
MSKRKTIIELQSKPQNKAFRSIIEKTKPVEFTPILETRTADSVDEHKTADDIKRLKIKSNEKFKTPTTLNKKSAAQTNETRQARKASEADESAQSNNPPSTEKSVMRKKEAENVEANSLSPVRSASAQTRRMRIFQTSTPVTRTLTKFQKAAIVVRGENGRQLVELLWRDQMNEKTRDIWDFLRARFIQIEDRKAPEITVRKRDILEGSGVKSDRTFISAVYTLEDMGLIEVKRLSGNKAGNIYILTEEGREEINSY